MEMSRDLVSDIYRLICRLVETNGVPDPVSVTLVLTEQQLAQHTGISVLPELVIMDLLRILNMHGYRTCFGRPVAVSTNPNVPCFINPPAARAFIITKFRSYDPHCALFQAYVTPNIDPIPSE